MFSKCRACGNELMPTLAAVQDPITSETFALSTCARCGLGHTVPQPEHLNAYYGEAYYGNRHGLTARHCTRRRLMFVGEATRGMPCGGRLLDVGCGDGSFMLAAREAGWNVVGTELNPILARRAGLEVWEGLEKLVNSDPFDCVTLWHSLEHMRDINATLAQIVKVLKPDGCLIIAVPDHGGLQSKLFRQRWLHLDVPRHLYHFDLGSLTSCLKGAGFAVQRTWHQEFEYDLLGWSQSLLNCVFSVPNVFFYQLTGKPTKVGLFIKSANWVAGLLLTALFVPAVAVGAGLGRGGTLIAVAGLRR